MTVLPRGTYVTGLGTTLASHVTFSGQATILPGWYAGYVLQLEMDEADPLINQSQNVNVGPTFLRVRPLGMGVPNVFYSYWFVKSDHLGKVSVGLQSSAGDNAAILVDGSGSLVPANWVTFDNGHFFLREKNGALIELDRGQLSASATSALVPMATAWESRKTSCAMTARPLLASRSVPTGVRTPTGMPMPAMLASGTASSLLRSAAGLRPTAAVAIRLPANRSASLAPVASTRPAHMVRDLCNAFSDLLTIGGLTRRCGLLAVRPLHRACGNRSVRLG